MTIALPAPTRTSDVTFRELLDLPATRQVMIKALCLVKKQLENNRPPADDHYDDLEFEIYKLYRGIPVDERTRAWEYGRT